MVNHVAATQYDAPSSHTALIGRLQVNDVVSVVKNETG